MPSAGDGCERGPGASAGHLLRHLGGEDMGLRAAEHQSARGDRVIGRPSALHATEVGAEWDADRGIVVGHVTAIVELPRATKSEQPPGKLRGKIAGGEVSFDMGEQRIEVGEAVVAGEVEVEEIEGG